MFANNTSILKRLSLCLILLSMTSMSQAFVLRLNSSAFTTSPTFSDVRQFEFAIDIAAPLIPGEYNNPALNRVVYRVVGVLEPGTPSEFPSFDLQRDISGADFYAQGSSLRFEIAQDALLDDGLQVDELVSIGGSANEVFVFDGREVGNGRFHPAILRLNSDGSGSIRNSNNVPTLEPMLEVEPGAEYITELQFDVGNLALYVPPRSGGGGAIGVAVLLSLFGLWVIVRRLN